MAILQVMIALLMKDTIVMDHLFLLVIVIVKHVMVEVKINAPNALQVNPCQEGNVFAPMVSMLMPKYADHVMLIVQHAVVAMIINA